MTSEDGVLEDLPMLRRPRTVDVGIAVESGRGRLTGRAETPKWRRMLDRELAQRSNFERLSVDEWRRLLRARSVTSTNHDTVLSLDWPHYCVAASVACGGASGYCYTFTGLLAGNGHIRKVAMVDVLAMRFPELFAETVIAEVDRAVGAGALPYRNLRYSGSGELTIKHINALALVAEGGVHLWGFTKSIEVAKALHEAGIAVIVSYDRSTPRPLIASANKEGLPLAYSSDGVEDIPPSESVVVFPIHRSGRIQEVADVPRLCPKVVHEYLNQERPAGTCQTVCQRCHRP